LQGARDIIAEMINEDSNIRSMIRLQFEKHAVLYTKASKGKEVEGNKYQDYFSFDEPLNRCPSHRLLAVFRGEEEGFLKLSIEPDEDIAIKKIEYQYIKRHSESSKQLAIAIKDAYKRLLAPSMENEFRSLAKARADEEAIKVFAENLRQLLLSAPLGNNRILAIDPGFRSGCKVVCLNEEGKLLADDIKKEAAAKRHPLQKFGNVNDIAAMAAFLLSKDASFITGQVIKIDGGLSNLR
jgi:uncharacterized protein